VQRPVHSGATGHLTDHILPRVPMRQRALAAHKRLRPFLERDAALMDAALRLFPRTVESCGSARSRTREPLQMTPS